MEPIATFSGLASGVQWRDMVDQIMQVESRPATLLEQQITRTQTRSAAWLTFQTALTSFQDAAEALADGSAFESFSTSVAGSGFSARAGSDATPGSYSVEVLQLAQAEKLGGAVVASSSEALGQAGEFWLNGRRIQVDTGDSLADIAYAINGANTGADATGVSAAVVSAGDGTQLVLSSRRTGADGIDLVDGDGVLIALGFHDGSAAIKHGTSDGARSDGFASRTTAVSTLLGLAGATAATVQMGGIDVAIDLDTDLEALASAIDTALGASGSAQVVSDTVDGDTVYRIDISGTTSFTDVDGVLEKLGVLEGGRGDVQQTVASATAFQDGGAAATTASLLADLEVAGTEGAAQAGDTLTLAGTRRDGTTFELEYTIQAGDTLQDVLDALNDPTALGGSATATIDATGRLVVSDDTGGASRLGLSVVAHNENGGVLDFGDFAATAVGRSREIVSGTDAAIRVDGIYSTHSSNSVAGVLPGVSMTLIAPTTEPGTVTIARDTDAVVDAVGSLVDAYNAVETFVSDQFTGGEGSTKPLAGDGTLRSLRDRLRGVMQYALGTGMAGSWTRLGDVGIQIQSDGTFALDEAAFGAALETDPLAVERLLGVAGTVTGSGLSYLSASDQTESGTYTVGVTANATRAATSGTGGLADGFDLAAADDTVTITDIGGGHAYEVTLLDGVDTAEDVLARIQQELAASLQHTVASATLEVDGGGPATTDTTWAEVFQGGVAAGAQDGDTVTVSGRRVDGTSFMRSYTIGDASTETLGALRDRIQNAVGAGVAVELDGTGAFVATADDAGSSLLELTISSDNVDLTTQVQQRGRPAAGIQATLVDGAIQLTHEDYGSAAGFKVEYSDPNTGTELGWGASGTEYLGTDVVGTIGGTVAEGVGRLLTGAAATAAEGLTVEVDTDFVAGSVTFSRGIAAVLEQALEPILGTEAGSIQSIVDGLDERVGTLNDRIDEILERVERRRESLIQKFIAMEQAMAVAQNQSAWLASQISSLASSYSSTNQ